ncbi:MAG: hypothetical protein V4591_11500 [Bdellovibrionota bacterium]
MLTFTNRNFFNFEKNYRPFLQGVRTSVAISSVIIIYYFTPGEHILWLGLCCLSLSQTCIRSPYFRYETNMLLSYIIVAILILCAYPFSQSAILASLYSFFLVFLIFIFSYYKLNSLYFVWTYLIPQFSLLNQKKFPDTISDAFMATIAFGICFIICTTIRPKLKTECIYEMRAALKSLSSYIKTSEKYSIDGSEKAIHKFMEKRSEMILSIKNFRLMTKEIEKNIHHSNLYEYLILISLIDLFIEIIIQICMRLRFEKKCQIFNTEEIINLYRIMDDMNSSFILCLKNKINLKDIEKIIDQFEIKPIKIITHHNMEITSIVNQFKSDLVVLKSEFKRLSEKAG